MEVTIKQPLPSPGRTQGDGMENVEDSHSEITSLMKKNTLLDEEKIKHSGSETVSHKREKNILGNKLIYHPSDLKQYCSNPPVITGKIVNLVPKHFTQTKKETVLLGNLKTKEPKFVPYEPYKAAVKPIIPYEKKGKNGERKISRKNTDLKVVLPEVPKTMGSDDSYKEPKKDDNSNTSSVINQDWEVGKKVMEEELKTLREENGQLESQLKFQAQVNAELKTLLVAAVGEDLETRVHLLTEDKLQLARALLNSAQRLSTHQEQTEWLAGQCEVWRSKFLASSLMVEELARWKAALCQKVTELQEAMKRLLEERKEVRGALLNTYRNLSVLRENFDHTHMTLSPSRKTDLPSTNIVDLSAGDQRLSEVLKLQLLGSSDCKVSREPDFTGLDMNTMAEKVAESILLNPNPLLMSGRPDAACNAVMGAAVAVGSLGISPLMMSSCAHCSGEVKLL